MELLDDRCLVRRDMQDLVAKFVHRIPVLPGQPDRLEAQGSRGGQCFQNALGLPGRGNADKDVAFTAKPEQLPFKDVHVSVVVCYGCHDRRIGGQGDRRKRRPLHEEPGNKFASNVLGIARTTAIPSQQKLAASLDRASHELAKTIQLVMILLVLGEFGELFRRFLEIPIHELKIGAAQDSAPLIVN